MTDETIFIDFAVRVQEYRSLPRSHLPLLPVAHCLRVGKQSYYAKRDMMAHAARAAARRISHLYYKRSQVSSETINKKILSSFTGVFLVVVVVVVLGGLQHVNG